MIKNKVRKQIPTDIAARVLFFADRTCCVCRTPGKPVQIHHIDENPENNDIKNLSVLCLDCHNETMIKGGFGRKLNSEQIILYRDDWNNKVAEKRASYELKFDGNKMTNEKVDIELATSLAEIYRENEQYIMLAIHYSSIGNYELRDKYIEIAISNGVSEGSICFLRALQNRADLIPENTINQQLDIYLENKNWSQRARLLNDIGRYKEATENYILDVKENLGNENIFSAAYYLKELVEEGLIEKLFELALKKSAEEDDLWWQIRSLEELGWYSEINDLVLKNAKRIEESNDSMLLIKLEIARKNFNKVKEIRKNIAHRTGIEQISE
ncbi:HNH endonuclease signature motif containing protein [Abyssisolibacter fermentans]|uniref:HNH endonuclease signature motif containing protein n=1 Tax=Abyssisolibacter fermentans TaxID=1766203 RepID=UPI00082E0196|nr:HNH endonuclease signature motif containing protein [Abyssisolibacter fermentans]